ncbi:inactive peptidyl-prolyl cis-trans isomerase FKBP6-like [Oscarella lobularis]|uniref:inactive peptidyl-prolyl cis-trans isomerase FKBP6-like n=1 Tax=Oscarella lobularis TaxID=121494 RepID=UPI003313F9BC
MSPVDGTKGGVKKKVLREGVGSIVPQGATVRVHYNGYLENDAEPFDSTRLRGPPQRMKLGGGMILGFDMALTTMRKSEVSQFLIHPEWAFGAMGCPPRVPGNATLLFEIELVSFSSTVTAEEIDETFAEDAWRSSSIAHLVKVSMSERQAGNEFFSQGQYQLAMTRYEKCIGFLEKASMKDEAEEKMWREELIKLYLNVAVCCIRKRIGPKAITYCNKVRDLDRRNAKAYFCQGQAYRILGEFYKARNMCLEAARLKPNSAEIRQELALINKKKTEMKEVETGICRKMLGSWKIEPQCQEDVVSTKEAKSSASDGELAATAQEQREALEAESTGADVKIYSGGTLSQPQLAGFQKGVEELGLTTEFTQTIPEELEMFFKN